MKRQEEKIDKVRSKFGKIEKEEVSLEEKMEYLTDYASPETAAIGNRLIEKEVLNVPNEKARKIVLENLRLIEQDNRRDFRF